MEILEIRENLSIPMNEIRIQACRSSGPGGQHVNTSSTKVRVIWIPSQSSALSEEEKAYLCQRLSYRITKEGEISCASQNERSQAKNLDQALNQLKKLILDGLFVPKERIATKPSRSQRESRMREKRITAIKKSHRSDKGFTD
jgi:ribosome-associated protein